MTAGPAAIAQSSPAVLGGIALQKAMLAFAPDFRWLILAFHFIISITIDVATISGEQPPLLRPIRHSEPEKIAAEPQESTAQIFYCALFRGAVRENLTLSASLEFCCQQRQYLFY
jgi:hypothetical protein